MASNNCVLISSYDGHKFFLNSFLHSIQMKTPRNIPIYVIVTRADYIDFQYLSQKYSDINVNFIVFSDAVMLLNCVDIDENILFNQLGKSKYQSLKKMYGLMYLMLYKNMENVIIFDSECMLVREFDIDAFINNYVQNPTYVYSSCTSANNGLHHSINRSTFELLRPIGNYECFRDDMWMLEYYMWVYERRIFLRFVESLVLSKRMNLIDIMRPLNEVFIENVYFTYIYFHTEFGYKFIDFIDQLKLVGATQTDISDMLRIVAPLKPMEDVRFIVENGTYEKYIGDVYDNLNLSFYKTTNSQKSLDFIMKHECIKVCVSEYSDIIFRHLYSDFIASAENSFFRCRGFFKTDKYGYRLCKNSDGCCPFNWIGFEFPKIIGTTYVMSCDISVAKQVTYVNGCMTFLKSHEPCTFTPVKFDNLVPGEEIHCEYVHVAQNNIHDLFILIFDDGPQIDITIKNIRLIIKDK